MVYKYKLSDKIKEVSTTGGAGGYLSKYAFAKKIRPPKETINESIVNEIFLSLLKIVLAAAGAGLSAGLAYLLKYIFSFLLNGINNYVKNIKNLINPDQFTKFTTELSKSKEFNGEFINLLVKHGGIKDTNIDLFLKDIISTREFNDILEKYYPLEDYKYNSAERNNAIREFRIGIKNTIQTNGSWLIQTLRKKFPNETKDLKLENLTSPGATLGPGPKAGPEGVKDNYYVTKFKYKLVPKDKNGNYVQKGSGLEVKNLF